MNKKGLKFLISFTFVLSLFGNTIGVEKVNACYPAYKCMSNAVIPKKYTLIYESKDRRKGILIGGVVLGATGFIGTPAAVFSFVTGTYSSLQRDIQVLLVL